jgi:hypothetical protein
LLKHRQRTCSVFIDEQAMRTQLPVKMQEQGRAEQGSLTSLKRPDEEVQMEGENQTEMERRLRRGRVLGLLK